MPMAEYEKRRKYVVANVFSGKRWSMATISEVGVYSRNW